MLENMPEDARKQLEWLINAIMKHFYLLFKYNKIDYVTEGSIAGLWDPNTTPAEEQKLFMKDLEKIYGSEIKSVNDILRALSTAVIKLADVITSKKFPEDEKLRNAILRCIVRWLWAGDIPDIVIKPKDSLMYV